MCHRRCKSLAITCIIGPSTVNHTSLISLDVWGWLWSAPVISRTARAYVRRGATQSRSLQPVSGSNQLQQPFRRLYRGCQSKNKQSTNPVGHDDTRRRLISSRNGWQSLVKMSGRVRTRGLLRFHLLPAGLRTYPSHAGEIKSKIK